jgi:hypothetical protein
MRDASPIVGIVVAALILALILFARGTPDHGTPTSPHPSAAAAAAIA